MLNKMRKKFKYGQNTIIVETGTIASNTSGSALIYMDDTVVLSTVVIGNDIDINKNFLSLNVEYNEKFYSSGRIPGNFFKRENKPSEKEILVSRLIDRSIRPLFSKNFPNDIQIVVHVLSLNPEIKTDIPSIIASFLSVSFSNTNLITNIGCIRIGYINNFYIVNPTVSQLKKSKLNMIISSNNKYIFMIESEMKNLKENLILKAIMFGFKNINYLINIINNFSNTSKKKINNDLCKIEKAKILCYIEKSLKNFFEKIFVKIKKFFKDDILKIFYYLIYTVIKNFNNKLNFISPNIEEINKIYFNFELLLLRHNIIAGNARLDGRCNNSIRPIFIKTGLLPRAHGSSLFKRGETQSLSTVTLSSSKDAQIVDNIMGRYENSFIVHYNMIPFSTCEIGKINLVKRRDIGHGNIIKRSLKYLLPKKKYFQYSIRLVSDITESNGSSSMASVCSCSLALINAGVSLKNIAAGIAVGLILNYNKFSILTDISGSEDYMGDMDFKISGTKYGVTSIQMDIKKLGISKNIIELSLKQAKKGRKSIIEKMEFFIKKNISYKLSKFAPNIISLKICHRKIKDIIGKGGSTIRSLTEKTGIQIDIYDNGNIILLGSNKFKTEYAKKMIMNLTTEIKIGNIYEGCVLKILDFGAIVQILPGKDGLLHISEISKEKINNINYVLKLGEVIKFKVISSDDKGRFRLSTKDINK